MEWWCGDFPDGLVVKNPPSNSNAGDTGSIPGPGTEIKRASGQLSQGTTTAQLTRSRACACQQEAPVPQPEGRPHALELEKGVHHTGKASGQPKQKTIKTKI